MPHGNFSFSSAALDLAALQQPLRDATSGGYASFEGWVRNHNEGLAVLRLEYEAFQELAISEAERIIEEARARFGVEHVRCAHRVGMLAIGDVAVWVGVSAPHRDEAFRACRYIIDEVKHRLPIWKKEHYVNGDSGWVNCERCASAPQHAHDASHDHSHDHSHAHASAAAPDYSRQMALREVGAAGQQRLGASHVAVVGAGGLGVPVLQYLAGAGVGRLTIIDADVLEASNLHRQTLYALADCGTPKAELAARHLRALNPQVALTTHVQRIDAANGSALLANADVIIDCSDNFSTKFLINDLAQQLGVPAVLASIYQFEGQLQVVDPRRNSSCLRCIWPEATRDGLIGNCAEAGVLGPVPGVFGSLQALEALKLLLNLPGVLQDELLTMDLATLSSTHLRARRHASCGTGSCPRCSAALQKAGQQREVAAADLELRFADLADALHDGLALIDIREAEELREQPLPSDSARHLPLAQLLTGAQLPAEGRYLLICAHGVRSLAAARELRSRGLQDVYSLRGGVHGLRTG